MKTSHFSPDIQDFLLLLSTHKVRNVIVGGEAVIYHGFARLTGDIDFFYEPTAENARRLYRTLDKFWRGSIPGIQSPRELTSQGVIVQFGVPPNRYRFGQLHHRRFFWRRLEIESQGKSENQKTDLFGFFHRPRSAHKKQGSHPSS